MATFPALEPDAREHGWPDVPQAVAAPWGGVETRSTTAPDQLFAGETLQLTYLDRPLSEVNLIRTHYRGQRDGLALFSLSEEALAGDGLTVTRGDVWRYAGPPEEEHSRGRLFTVRVSLEAVGAYLVPPEVSW